MSARVRGQIRGDETAFARNHVAAGTSCLAEENGLSADGITGQLHHLLRSLKRAQVGYYRFDVRSFEGAEGRHSSARNAILDDAGDLGIGELLHFWIFGDVGSAFGAPPVQAMAGCTSRHESLLAPRRNQRDILLSQTLPWHLRPCGEAIGGPQNYQC